MKTSKLFVVALFALGAAGTVQAASSSDYNRAKAEATAAYDKVNKHGYAWTVAEDALKDAEAAAKSGNWNKAVDLAQEATVLSEQAYKQYESEKDAGPLF